MPGSQEEADECVEPAFRSRSFVIVYSVRSIVNACQKEKRGNPRRTRGVSGRRDASGSSDAAGGVGATRRTAP